MEGDFVVVGGGIAGITCTETLAFLEPTRSIVLVSESSLIKMVTNIRAVTKMVVDFDVEERSFERLTEIHPNIRVVHDSFVELDNEDQCIKTSSGRLIKYKYLCLCTGAQPKVIPQANNNPCVVGIRDTDSVETFVEKLSKSKKILIVGNGGIASELVYKIQNTEIIWAVKDKHITATFVDPGAAEFFQPSLHDKKPETKISKRMRYQEDHSARSGAALGPDWYTNFEIKGALNTSNIKILYQTEVQSVETVTNSEHPLKVVLTNGTIVECDLIVSATGVEPRGRFKTKNPLALSDDGGLQVDVNMRTSLPNVYAAGDLCNANWGIAKHWFQMKLWTQARYMGAYAAKCMSGASNGEDVLQDFCFEMFAHTTKLFGYKVILLGLYNGQKLGNDYEILLRTTKGVEYIKFVLQNDRLQGAVLIGDTDLEETCENLILNQLDLSPYGDDILNPNIDIEDYFD